MFSFPFVWMFDFCDMHLQNHTITSTLADTTPLRPLVINSFLPRFGCFFFLNLFCCWIFLQIVWVLGWFGFFLRIWHWRNFNSIGYFHLSKGNLWMLNSPVAKPICLFTSRCPSSSAGEVSLSMSKEEKCAWAILWTAANQHSIAYDFFLHP